MCSARMRQQANEKLLSKPLVVGQARFNQGDSARKGCTIRGQNSSGVSLHIHDGWATSDVHRVSAAAVWDRRCSRSCSSDNAALAITVPGGKIADAPAA